MKMNTKYSIFQLCDLPDEILMIIFKNLYKITLLYSLIGVNKRLNKIVHDPSFTSHLSFITRGLSDTSVYPLPDPILNRFCLQILPSIHDKIRWLYLESSSMTRILLSTNYPNLYGLSLFNIREKKAIHLFTDETLLTHFNKNQILAFIIDINTNANARDISLDNLNALIFTHVLTIFNNLRYLCFGPTRMWWQRLSFKESPAVFSSTLLELDIYLTDFTDCLYLLDGRFNQLHILCVNIRSILPSNLKISNKEKLPNLKCFTLDCRSDITTYDELIVPLLHRMSNLEKLDLYLMNYCINRFIDGYDLKKDIINHMPRLNKFIFNIQSVIVYYNQNDLLSNEDIQYTFKDFKDDHIISCVDYFAELEEAYCRIYSYPYKLKYYEKISNNFPGGLFKYVRKVSLFDERPFEHDFFLQIEKSFPLLEDLTVINEKSQNNKQCRQSKNDNQNLSIIKYSHLIKLSLFEAHKDYVEQFLVDTKMCLTNGICLSVKYQSLQNLTYNFRRDDTRINCAKLNRLILLDNVLSFNKPEYSSYLKDYFPHTTIL